MDRERYVFDPIGHSGSTRDRGMVELAVRQDGVIGLDQLLALGLSYRAVALRVQRGCLYEHQPRVYSLLPSLTARGRMRAALLTCGPDAVLSHRAAGAVMDLTPWPTGAIDVTAPRRRRPRRGVRLHRVSLIDDERAIHDGFPVTSVARTLVDLAAVLPRGRLEDVFDRAERLRIFDRRAIERQLDRNPGRRGNRAVRALLAEAADSDADSEPEPDRSELERAFRRLCCDAGLPPPSQNVAIEGFEVDAAWPAAEVIVELDGWQFHRTRRDFERDHHRGAVLELRGYRVLRFTWRQITQEPALVTKALRRALDGAAASTGASTSAASTGASTSAASTPAAAASTSSTALSERTAPPRG